MGPTRFWVFGIPHSQRLEAGLLTHKPDQGSSHFQVISVESCFGGLKCPIGPMKRSTPENRRSSPQKSISSIFHLRLALSDYFTRFDFI